MPTTTLHDGRQVDSASAEWRLECLARYALNRGTRAEVDKWLQAFAEKQPKAIQELRDRMNSINSTRKSVKRAPAKQS